MAIILYIETSTLTCAVAVSIDRRVIVNYASHDEKYSHAEKLNLLIEKALHTAEISFKQLNAVAVSAGLGSYTGLRIGMSTAKGICYAMEIPIIPISTLQSMAQPYLEGKINHNNETLFCPMVDARRIKVYTALYNKLGEVVIEPNALVIDTSSFQNELQNHRILFFGSGAEKCMDVIKSKNAEFDLKFKMSAHHMVQPAMLAYENKEFADIAYCEPYYLKSFMATIPASKI